MVLLVLPPISRVPTVWPPPLTCLTPPIPHFCHGPSHTNFRAPRCELYTRNFYTVSVNSCRNDLEVLRALLTYPQHFGVRMVLSLLEQTASLTGALGGSTDLETGSSPCPLHALLDTNVLCDFIEDSYSATLKFTSLILVSYYTQFCARSTCFLCRGVLPSHPVRR